MAALEELVKTRLDFIDRRGVSVTKTAFSIILILASTYAVLGQTASLVDKVTELQITEDKTSALLAIEIELCLKNESQSNLILFKDDYVVVGHSFRTDNTSSASLL